MRPNEMVYVSCQVAVAGLKGYLIVSINLAPGGSLQCRNHDHVSLCTGRATLLGTAQERSFMPPVEIDMSPACFHSRTDCSLNSL